MARGGLRRGRRGEVYLRVVTKVRHRCARLRLGGEGAGVAGSELAAGESRRGDKRHALIPSGGRRRAYRRDRLRVAAYRVRDSRAMKLLGGARAAVENSGS